jgi:glycosyltransferase involved in cell wall biosynthesis
MEITEYFKDDNSPLFVLIPNLEVGGSEKLLIDIARSEKVNKKRSVTLIICNNKGKLFPPEEVDVIFFNKSNMLFCLYNLYTITREKKITLFTSMVKCNLTCCFIKLVNRNINLIIRESTSFSYYLNKLSFFRFLIVKFLIRLFYPFANQLILPAEDLAIEFLSNLGNFPKEKIVIKSNPIDSTKLNLLSKEPIPQNLWTPQHNRHVFIHVGRLDKNKNQQLIIRKLSKIKNLDFEFIILGDGPEKSNLEKLVLDLGLQNKVKFLGFIANPYSYMKASHTFILSSINEGYPNVLVQAKFFGLNIISTDCKTGPKEILRDYDKGYLTNIEMEDFDLALKHLNIV